MTVKTVLAALTTLFCAVAAQAAMDVPKASGKALGVTRGQKVFSGLVFVNGKYLPPPYVVSRWGNGIRINNVPVTGQIVRWVDFLKTQPNVKVVKGDLAAPEEPSQPAAAPAAAAPVEAEPAAPVETVVEVSESALDDLFEDDPQPAKKPAAAEPVSPAPVAPAPVATAPAARPSAARKGSSRVVYTLEGEFVKNAAAKALVAKVNAIRTSIDAHLRSGGFFCFGDAYSRVSGDVRMATQLLDRLPELLQKAETESDLTAAVRSAGLYFLHEEICRDLFRSRADYRRLQELRRKWKKDDEWRKLTTLP